ncbi:TcpQ domain-containing protein, partial [Palleronia sp.]|uniref:TcpQ domain-containing protein n=1 Tax=Palleronia sp. TaxID=1940284 RepID=UPI0035C81B77
MTAKKRNIPHMVQGVVAGALAATMILPATATRADVEGETLAPVIHPADGWAVMSGASLKATLEGWTRAAGWTLIWDNAFDYRLRASAAFGGGFEEATGRLIDS